MGYFPVRYDSRVVNYDRKKFIRLATGLLFNKIGLERRLNILFLFFLVNQLNPNQLNPNQLNPNQLNPNLLNWRIEVQ